MSFMDMVYQRESCRSYQDKPVSQKLLHLGVLPDKLIRFIKTAPMGDPLEFEVEGTNFSVRRKDASSISVELIA